MMIKRTHSCYVAISTLTHIVTVMMNIHNLYTYTYQIQRILGSGYTLQRNTVLQQHIEKVFGLPLVIKEGIDSPLGAAMAVEQLQQ